MTRKLKKSPFLTKSRWGFTDVEFNNSILNTLEKSKKDFVIVSGDSTYTFSKKAVEKLAKEANGSLTMTLGKVESSGFSKAEWEVNETKVGTEVIALGSPNGLENSASVGYLTGTGRDIRDDFFYEKAYQIDVQVETGSSGGPLIDAKTGKVIGINSLLLEKNRRIGFSIPLYTMTYLIDDWIKSPMSDRQVASVFGVYDDYGTSRSYNEDSYNSDSSEDEVEDYEGDVYFYEEWLQDFILEFRTVYEEALYNENFYQIEPYLLPGSAAYSEFADYFAEISGEGMYFEFIENTVTEVTIYDEYALVSTYETLNFRNKAGNEKYYVKEKNYEVVMHTDGTYRIRDVSNR